MNTFNLQSKTALIVGGAGHIGQHITEAFAANGCNAIAFSPNATGGTARSNAPVEYIDGDISSRVDQETLRCHIVDKYEGLEALVFCMIPRIRRGAYDIKDRDDFLSHLEKSVVSLADVICKFESLLKAGDGASVVIVKSVYSVIAPDFRLYPDPTLVSPLSYHAIQGAWAQMCRYYASFYGPSGIRFNSVTLGNFMKPEQATRNPEYYGRSEKLSVLGRTGIPEDVVGAVLYLASDLSRFTTGSDICVDGGWTVLGRSE